MALSTIPRGEEFAALLRQRLSEETAYHSISVAETMVSIAETDLGLGVSACQAAWAGLLHDLCKETDDESLRETAARYKVELTESQRTIPALLHGPVAAAICRHELGIQDESVCDAIRWHTTGRPGFGRLGCLLYFADFAEPFRPLPQAAQARAILATEGFDDALVYVAGQRYEHIRNRPTMDPVTEAFYHWLTRDTGT